MKTVKRYDVQIKLDGMETLPGTGFLKIPVFAARTGIQMYRRSDGTIIREFRPAEEVFSEKTMASLRNAPMTNNHPKEMVNVDNAKDLMTGFTDGIVEKVDEKFLKTNLIVTDKQAIESINRGKIEVSMGYHVELDEEPGEFEGERYDVVQRNIVHNHIALVDRGRAGREVRLRLDGEDAVLVDDLELDNLKRKDKEMPKLKLGDKEFEADGDLVKAVESEMKKLKDQLDEMMKQKDKKSDSNEELEKLQARVDHLEGELRKAEDKNKTVNLDALKERRTLEKVAEKTLPKDEFKKIDDMKDLDIRKAVILAECPEAKLDGKSDAYITARFDHIAESLNASEDVNKEAGKTAAAQRKTDSENQDKGADAELEKKQQESEKKDSEAWMGTTATMKTADGFGK